MAGDEMVRCQLHEGRNLKVLSTEVSIQYPEQCLGPTGNRHSVFVKWPVLKRLSPGKGPQDCRDIPARVASTHHQKPCKHHRWFGGALKLRVLKMTLKQFVPQRQVLPVSPQGRVRDC